MTHSKIKEMSGHYLHEQEHINSFNSDESQRCLFMLKSNTDKQSRSLRQVSTNTPHQTDFREQYSQA